MAEAWEDARHLGAQGVIWMDPDVVADLADLSAMLEAIQSQPGAVWASMIKLWPASTGHPLWVWGHGGMLEGKPVLSHELADQLGWFSLGMTYTPARLLELAVQDLPVWVFGTIDMNLSRYAREWAVPIHPVFNCRPKHLHFYPRPGDLEYRAAG